jgi:HEAT repeat protein
MTTTQALAFLQQHQPLPPDEMLAQNLVLIETYDEVRKHFTAHPDPRCVALFLNSFGDRDGLGVYQLVDSAFYPLDYDLVVRALFHQLEKGDTLPQSVLYWNVNLCMPFVDVTLREPLARLLAHSDVDIRLAAIGALSLINDQRSRDILTKQLFVETDDHAVEFLHEVLSEMDGHGPPPR